ncbi:putative magnesium transporter NIPA4 isoform X1 [Cucumis melo var. makuwa]|uniref:Probable magnesium transporter n=1 Tax=Cucumis melo var. makuwa TaxID=1194695 RepID=A0A5A7T0J3_CUCMM|nr:putative magnesium transporter NIPA4 isoform X1 [Cucumis melo var. makuwa]
MAVSGPASSSERPWSDPRKGMSSDNIKGLVLALSSSFFIGASFIVKKKGLKIAGASGVRAGDECTFFVIPSLFKRFDSDERAGGYSYLYEPLWWVGMITMVVGEIANFAAYAFAPAILVTPLGALSIIISAALAHIILRERLNIFGILGCVLCVVGSTTIVLHAPQEREIVSVKEVWDLATEPAFLLYAALMIATTLILIIHFVPRYGQTYVMVYIGVCSIVGSLSVMSVKALGIALKLTFSGLNQLTYPQTWAFTMIVITCVIIQMNYLNKALDTFNTAVVSPTYYVMFTTLTILASIIMFKEGGSLSLNLNRITKSQSQPKHKINAPDRGTTDSYLKRGTSLELLLLYLKELKAGSANPISDRTNLQTVLILTPCCLDTPTVL